MPSKQYAVRETVVTFKSTGGTVTFTPTSLANNAGRVSAQWDRGTGSSADRYIFRAKTKLAVAPAVGAILTIYLATSDGTDNDGELGTTDAALPAADRRRNLTPIGVIVADEASNTRFFITSGIIEILERFVQVVWYNEMGQALSATAADHLFELTPCPPEMQ
jgi:hypothetical protein